MNDSETYTFEDERRYINPTLSRDEQLGFVDTLRDTMRQNTADIGTQTERLGTNVPSNLGGLTGSNGYFAQRYQTTPLENQVNTLKATAQAKALNDLLSNYEDQMKNKAQQAYRKAARRASSNDTSSGTIEGEYLQQEPDSNVASPDMIMPTTGWPEGVSVRGYGTINNERFYQNADTGEVLYTDSPDWAKDSTGVYRYIGNWRANSRYNSRSDQQLADLTAAGKQPAVGNKIATPVTNRRVSISGGGGGW